MSELDTYICQASFDASLQVVVQQFTSPRDSSCSLSAITISVIPKCVLLHHVVLPTHDPIPFRRIRHSKNTSKTRHPRVFYRLICICYFQVLILDKRDFRKFMRQHRKLFYDMKRTVELKYGVMDDEIESPPTLGSVRRNKFQDS